jgi:cysteinyl-tRNA synthetase
MMALDITLYNTLTRQKEPFAPLGGGETVLAYTCGPTVYDFAHIGNLRAYVFMDTLRRALRRAGFSLRHVMNITDVGHLESDADTGEDKVEAAARKRKVSPYEISEEYTRVFMDDMAALGVGVPEIVAKATDHIQDMLAFVEELADKGFAYETSDGVYYDVSKFAAYGRLSRANLEEQLAGARVEVNLEKRNPADFALWIKAPKEHIMQWPSRWGMGYPGWHIECSAMARRYLGERIDIHTGGVDHIPIHHENEIAQSDALAGHQVVRTWMHGEFLMVDGGKMSKSLGNLFTLADLRARGHAPAEYRYMCLNAHYRSKLNFTWEGMKAAAVSLRRFADGALSHLNAAPQHQCAARTPEDGGEGARMARPPEDGGVNNGADNDNSLAALRAEFDEAVFDDLNMPKALGIAWQVVRRPEKSREAYGLLLDMDSVLGLGLAAMCGEFAGGGVGGAGAACAATAAGTTGAVTAAGVTGSATAAASSATGLPQEVAALLEERAAARAAKDWAKSDELRARINALGYSVADSKSGQTAKKDPLSIC